MVTVKTWRRVRSEEDLLPLRPTRETVVNHSVVFVKSSFGVPMEGYKVLCHLKKTFKREKVVLRLALNFRWLEQLTAKLMPATSSLLAESCRGSGHSMSLTFLSEGVNR